MKEIAIAYLKWDWIISCIVGGYMGYLSAKRRNPIILWITVSIILEIGITATIIKNK